MRNKIIENIITENVFPEDISNQILLTPINERKELIINLLENNKEHNLMFSIHNNNNYSEMNILQMWLT